MRAGGAEGQSEGVHLYMVAHWAMQAGGVAVRASMRASRLSSSLYAPRPSAAAATDASWSTRPDVCATWTTHLCGADQHSSWCGPSCHRRPPRQAKMTSKQNPTNTQSICEKHATCHCDTSSAGPHPQGRTGESE